MLFGVADVVAAQLGVHGVPVEAPPSKVGGDALTETRVLVIDEVVAQRPALEFAIVDGQVGFASGVRWRAGSLQLFAELLQGDRHGVVAPGAGTARRNDYLHGLADDLGVARSTISDGPTAPSRAISLGRSDLLDGAARGAMIERCIETLWVLWERHADLRNHSSGAADMLRDATEARR